MMKHKKIDGQLLQEALKENGIQVKPASGLAKPGKLVLTGEDGKAYAVGKNLEVARVQTEDPERIVLKASVKDAAGEQVAQIEKAVVVRTVGFETARANVVRQSEALDEMHRRVVQEGIRVAAARTVRGVAGPRAKAQEKVPRPVGGGQGRHRGAKVKKGKCGMGGGPSDAAFCCLSGFWGAYG